MFSPSPQPLVPPGLVPTCMAPTCSSRGHPFYLCDVLPALRAGLCCEPFGLPAEDLPADGTALHRRARAPPRTTCESQHASMGSEARSTFDPVAVNPARSDSTQPTDQLQAIFRRSSCPQ